MLHTAGDSAGWTPARMRPSGEQRLRSPPAIFHADALARPLCRLFPVNDDDTFVAVSFPSCVSSSTGRGSGVRYVATQIYNSSGCYFRVVLFPLLSSSSVCEIVVLVLVFFDSLCGDFWLAGRLIGDGLVVWSCCRLVVG